MQEEINLLHRAQVNLLTKIFHLDEQRAFRGGTHVRDSEGRLQVHRANNNLDSFGRRDPIEHIVFKLA